MSPVGLKKATCITPYSPSSTPTITMRIGSSCCRAISRCTRIWSCTGWLNQATPLLRCGDRFQEKLMDREWNQDQPIYRQLRDRVVAMILDGVLKEGEPLPSVRTVAAEYRV